MMDKPSTQLPENPNPDFKDRDINVGVVMVSLFALLLVVVVTIIGCKFWLDYYMKKETTWNVAESYFEPIFSFL